MTADDRDGPPVEFVEGLEVDGGDYRIVLTVLLRGHEVHVSRFAIEPKDPERHTVAPSTLREVAKSLPRAAEEALARHKATKMIPLEPGTVTIRAQNRDGSWSPPVDVPAVVEESPRRRADLERQYAAQRRSRLTDEDLQRVARAVRDAQTEGNPIQAEVARAMFVSESRAGHLIKMARDRGILERRPRRAQG